MKHYEREYFISRIRAGYYPIKLNDGKILKVYPPTIEQEFELNQIYLDSYKDAIKDDIKTEDEMIEWMIEKGLWSYEEDFQIKKSTEDLEKLKIEMFNSRFDKKKKEAIRRLVRGCEKNIEMLINKKNVTYENTCEGVSFVEKSYAMLKMCTYYNEEIFDFKDTSIEEIWVQYSSLILSDSKIREIARSDSWRSLWSLSETSKVKLFNNDILNIDQRNLLVWSKLYDNVSEHSESPSDSVIEDDDLLDGWIALQKQKRDQESKNKEADAIVSNNQNIRNSDEVFVIARDKEQISAINSLNSPSAMLIKNQRMSTVKREGEVKAGNFQDEKLKLSQMATNMHRNRFRR